MGTNPEQYLKQEYGINEKIVQISNQTEKEISDVFKSIESNRELNQYKVISAMQKNKVSDTHFGGTSGYGYDDRGRDTLDKVYAEIFKTEDALVRHSITTGTHALTIALFGNLRPGDELLSITGKPYDTLEEVIGIRGSGSGSLKDFGITYNQLELKPTGEIDYDKINEYINPRTKMILIQRSRGYGWRPSLTIEKIGKAIEIIKNLNHNIIVMVDNCYGEFVEDREPTEVGADLCAGSLIKNPGGGLALTGGYIAGKSEYIENAGYRLTTPGLGREVGASLGQNRAMYQGLFLAPHIVAESLKGAVFCAGVMKKLGFEITPQPDDKRSDIIQSIRFNNKESLIAFCQGIQKGSPVDAFVTPQPWDMPGYDCQVIMAAGAFVQGSSIELSADAPIKEPYTAYMQGGLVYEHVKLGVMIALQKMFEAGIITF